MRVYIYENPVVEQIKKDFDETLPKCVRMTKESVEALPALHKFCGKAMRHDRTVDVGRTQEKNGLSGERSRMASYRKRKGSGRGELPLLASFLLVQRVGSGCVDG